MSHHRMAMNVRTEEPFVDHEDRRFFSLSFAAETFGGNQNPRMSVERSTTS